MILDPSTGRPQELVREAIVVSDDSSLQASIYAYAIMVMGLDKGIKFLDQTQGVSGLILTGDHRADVSGKIANRFWR